MIIETQAVGPFFKNGSSRPARGPARRCHRSRRRGGGLLTFIAGHALTMRPILLTHAHVDYVTGIGAAKRALKCRSFCTATTCSSTKGRSSRAKFGLRGAAPPFDEFYTAGQVIVRPIRSCAPHAGTPSGRRLSADRQSRNPGRTSSSATRCLPARSDAWICPAATSTRSSRRSGTSCSHSARVPSCIPAMDRTRRSAFGGARPLSDSELTARGGMGECSPAFPSCPSCPSRPLSSCASRSSARRVPPGGDRLRRASLSSPACR